MIIFLGGNNDYAIVQHISKLKRQYARKYADALEMVECDLAESPLTYLEQQLLAVPMFYSHRLVMVRSLGQVTAEVDRLMALLDKVPDSTVAVLDGRGMDKRSKLYKMLAAHPSAKLHDAMSESDLVTWLLKEASRRGSTLDRAAAQLLVQRVAGDQWRLHHELDKLVAGGEQITRERILDLVQTDPTSSVFDLIAAVQSGDAQRSLRLYDELMRIGANEQQILATLQWHFRVMTMVYHDATAEELKQCGIKPYAATKAKQQSKHYSAKDLAASYQDLLMADVHIKSGIIKPHQAMTDLVLSLASRAQG